MAKNLALNEGSQLPADTALIERTRDSIRASKADGTLRAYRADWRSFEAFTDQHKIEALPALPEAVAAFLQSEADQGRKASTLARRVAAIKFAHESAGMPTPTDSKIVKDAMKGLRRILGTRPDKKKPVTADMALKLIAHTDDSLTGLRDKAILLLGFAGAFRRSELAALTTDDLKFSDNGVDILIRRSKTDQAGEGQSVAIIRGRSACPVEAVKDWLEAAEITKGPVFRGLFKGGKRIRASAISDKAIYDLVKKYAAKAGLDAADFGAHSLRSGFLTSAAEAGASISKMQAVSRHKSVDVLIGYVRHADRYKDHAGDGLL